MSLKKKLLWCRFRVLCLSQEAKKKTAEKGKKKKWKQILHAEGISENTSRDLMIIVWNSTRQFLDDDPKSRCLNGFYAKLIAVLYGFDIILRGRKS